MTTTTRDSRDNDKMADRAQKGRTVTKFIQTLSRLKIAQISTQLSSYILTMCTHTKLFNLIKTLKNPYLGRAPSNHQYVL